jgi:hypothetical protein
VWGWCFSESGRCGEGCGRGSEERWKSVLDGVLGGLPSTMALARGAERGVSVFGMFWMFWMFGMVGMFGMFGTARAELAPSGVFGWRAPAGLAPKLWTLAAVRGRPDCLLTIPYDFGQQPPSSTDDRPSTHIGECCCRMEVHRRSSSPTVKTFADVRSSVAAAVSCDQGCSSAWRSWPPGDRRA